MTTNSELATYTNQVSLAPQSTPAPVPQRQDLTQWVDQANQVAVIAEKICRTHFVPEHLRGKPEEVTAAILTGHEMGLSPMASLRSIYVVRGMPAMYAHAMRAVVQAHGHEIWVEEATDTRVIVCGRRHGTGEVQRAEWTMDRARKAGLTRNPQYTQHPRAMLMARATAEMCRLIAADALHGIPYAVEELEAEQVAEAGDVPEVRPQRRTARRKPLTAPPPEPELEPALEQPMPELEPAPEPEPEPPAEPEQPAEPMITEAQVTKLHAAFRAAGIRGRDAKIELIQQITGRVVASSQDLTRREASAVIDHLQAIAAQPAPPASAPEPMRSEQVNEPDDPPLDIDWPEPTQPGSTGIHP